MCKNLSAVSGAKIHISDLFMKVFFFFLDEARIDLSIQNLSATVCVVQKFESY